jgi:hypothetical protein
MSIFADLSSLKWSEWLYTIISAAIGAAATTIAANPLASVLGAQQFTPRQLGILAASSALVAVAGVLRKSPLPDRALAIALQPGVHTEAQVQKVLDQTAPGSVPSPEVTAAILAAPPAEVVPIVPAAKANP